MTYVRPTTRQRQVAQAARARAGPLVALPGHAWARRQLPFSIRATRLADAMSRRTRKRPATPAQTPDGTLKAVQARAPVLVNNTPRNFEEWLLWLHRHSGLVPTPQSSASSSTAAAIPYNAQAANKDPSPAETAAELCSRSGSVPKMAGHTPTPSTRADAETGMTTERSPSATPTRQQPLTQGRKPATPQRASYRARHTPTDAAASTSAGPEIRTETCQLCFEESPANTTVRLSCEHGSYCLCCLQRHATAQLDHGAIQLPCPDCRSPVAHHELRAILPPDMVDRFLTKSLEQAVLTTPGLFACPTADCAMRVALEDTDAASGCYSCELCGLTSCLLCKAQPYHTDLTCKEYEATQQDPSDLEFRRWMRESGTQQCPTCRMPITKDTLDGQETQNLECHKMVCRLCRTRFCFGCNHVLTDEFSCACTPADHGFVDPHTGAFISPYTCKKCLGTCSDPDMTHEKYQQHGYRCKLAGGIRKRCRPSRTRLSGPQTDSSPSVRKRTRAAARATGSSSRDPVRRH